RRPPLVPYTTPFRSQCAEAPLVGAEATPGAQAQRAPLPGARRAVGPQKAQLAVLAGEQSGAIACDGQGEHAGREQDALEAARFRDRKSTRLNSSHVK